MGRAAQPFHGVPGVSNIVTSDDPLKIFKLMITDELIDYVTHQTNLFFTKYSGKVFKLKSCVLKHLPQGGNNNNAMLYDANIA